MLEAGSNLDIMVIMHRDLTSVRRNAGLSGALCAPRPSKDFLRRPLAAHYGIEGDGILRGTP